MRKFFVNDENIVENNIKILGTDVNHIKNVLRLKIDDVIQICNSKTQKNYVCKITEITKNIVNTEIIDEIDTVTEGNIELTIFQGLPKSDKMELIIQKGTELGVTKFVPVAFKRCIVKLTGKDEEKKISRWQKIAEMASKQSHRDIIPKVEKVIDAKKICNFFEEYDIVLLAYEDEKENYIKNELLKLKESKDKLKIAVIIGPEGGIEFEEVQQMKNEGAKVISLGKRILRTETVALQVSSIIMYELET